MRLLPDGRIGHILIRGANVTRGYYEEPQVNAAAFTPDGWLRTGDIGLVLDGELYITGRAKEIIFVNGQNYYPHDLENIATARRAWNWARWSWPAYARRAPKATSSPCSCCIAATWRNSRSSAATIARLINEHAGLEVAQVVPVKRIPKTTSGKIQRHLLEQQLVDGEFAAELAEIARHGGQLAAGGDATSGGSIEEHCWPSATACWRRARSARRTTCSRSARAH